MTTRNIITSLIVGSCLLPLSSALSAKDLQDINTFPKWFQDSMAREAKIKGTSKLVLEEYGINAEVKGKFKLIDNSDGVVVYNIDIGSGSPVECYVFSSFDGPANSLISVLDYSLTGVEALNKKKLSGKFNYALNVGVVDSTPYVGLDLLYNVGEGAQKVAGILKGASAQTNDILQMCIHNEIGYNQSFMSIFESFVTGFSQYDNNNSFFEVSYKMSVNDIPMGYTLERYTKDSDGDVEISNKTALILPVDANSVSRSDTAVMSWSSPNGSLINALESTVENGVLSSDFALSYAEDAWQVSGTMQGKEVTKTLSHTGSLLSGYGSYVELANLRASQETSGDYHMWSAGADPTLALPVKLTKLKDDPEANFEIDMGAIVMKFLADDSGVFQQGSLNQGPISMKLEKMHSVGEPKLP